MTVQLCRGCNEPALSPSRYCARHIEWYRQYHRNRTKKRQAAGLCTQCKRPAVPGYRRCEKCKIQNLEQGRRHIEKKVKNGICRYCTKKVVSGYDKCFDHLTIKQKAELESTVIDYVI